MKQDPELLLKVQALHDGELPPAEAARVRARLAEDPAATALLGHLEAVRSALRHYEAECTLPESREFFWSKVRRDILRASPGAAREQARAPAWGFWLRYFVPAGAVALLALALVFGLRPAGISPRGPAVAMGLVAVETALLDTRAVTYRDEDAGVTLVWLSFAGENQFTPLTAPDTLPQ